MLYHRVMALSDRAAIRILLSVAVVIFAALAFVIVSGWSHPR